MRVVDVEVSNQAGAQVDEEGAVDLVRRVVAAEGLEDAEVGLVFVSAARIAELKGEHLGLNEPTDVLAFPIDGRDELPDGVPRQLGDVVLCPEVVREEWRTPLVHGLLHLLGYDHGEDMQARERLHAG
ncbi:MAG: rRNA maturation RNase YbeY [Actinobacteria bacterium]|nr:MAG: rRNA maturation RNase YbeY [Actinomycetota bacterium]